MIAMISSIGGGPGNTLNQIEPVNVLPGSRDHQVATTKMHIYRLPDSPQRPVTL
jgi:hypothetical protein